MKQTMELLVDRLIMGCVIMDEYGTVLFFQMKSSCVMVSYAFHLFIFFSSYAMNLFRCLIYLLTKLSDLKHLVILNLDLPLDGFEPFNLFINIVCLNQELQGFPLLFSLAYDFNLKTSFSMFLDFSNIIASFASLSVSHHGGMLVVIMSS